MSAHYNAPHAQRSRGHGAHRCGAGPRQGRDCQMRDGRLQSIETVIERQQRHTLIKGWADCEKLKDSTVVRRAGSAGSRLSDVHDSGKRCLSS
jgi:hypothetical protein